MSKERCLTLRFWMNNGTMKDGFESRNGAIGRHSGIDICKLIMSLFVVGIHTGAYEVFGSKISTPFYNLCFSLAVPFFFVASGYLLGIKLSTDFADTLNGKFLIAYLKKISFMYITWSVVYIPLAIQGYYKSGISVIDSIKAYIINLLFVGDHYNSWPLWYLLSTIYIVAILYFANRFRIIKKYNHLLIISIIAFLFYSYFNAIYTISDSENSIFEIWAHGILESTIQNCRVLRGLIYLPIGIWLSKKDTISINIGILFLLSSEILNFCTDNKFVRDFCIIIATISIFSICLQCKIKASWTIVLNNSSKWIYLLHMYVYTFIYLWIWGRLSEN